MERYFKRKVPSPESSSDATPQQSAGESSIASNTLPGPAKLDYQARLLDFVSCLRLILRQGFPLCGLQWEEERRRTDFTSLLELHDSYKYTNGLIPQTPAEVLPTANADIQELIMRACAKETANAIVEDLGKENFGIHFAGFTDVEHNPVMAVVLRYVDKEGVLKERFIGIVDVGKCYSSEAVGSLFSEHGLMISRIRGLSYNDGGILCREISELSDYILRENKSAYLTHCSTQQLHSTLLAAAGEGIPVSWCGKVVADILMLVRARCKEHERLERKEREGAKIIRVLTDSEDLSPEELYKVSLRMGNTRWVFKYEILQKLADVFSSVLEVVDFVEENGAYADDRGKARWLHTWDYLEQFDFAFRLHLIKSVLGITHQLSLALEMEDPNVANAMKLVEACKQELQKMRDEGWEPLLAEVSAFCKSHDIDVPNMDDKYLLFGPKFSRGSNELHYRDEQFYGVIDSQLKELNTIFSEVNMELLLCATCLNPKNSFEGFDKAKLVKLAHFYPEEFSSSHCSAIEVQLDKYILDVRSDERFGKLNSLGDLSRKLVETKKHEVYDMVFKLLKLALILPITAPEEERAVSAMKLIETKLSDQICDQFMKDSLLTFIERDVFGSVSDDAILKCFESLKTRN